MYQVTCDNVIIYNDISLSKNIIAYSPILNISDNKAGSFKITLPKDNVGYDKITKMSSTISITKDSKWIWEGRAIKESIDFHNQKTIECEGALAYLNDIVLPSKQYRANMPRDLISQVLDIYNQRAAANRKIYIGSVTVNGDSNLVDYESNYENVLEFLTKNLMNIYGGHLFISKDSAGLKLNYYQDWVNTCSQTIDFGSNLVDFTKNYDFSNICTVCIPRGAQLSDDTFDGTTEDKINPSSRNNYLTVKEANNGSIYVESNIVSTYGRIEKVIDFNDIEDPNVLLELANIYMSSSQFEDLSMTVKAVDLHVLNPSIQSFNLLDQVKCISLPHGLDKYFPITAISIPLNRPDSVTYTMGYNTGGMTTAVSTTNSQIKANFDKVSSRESVLKEAFRNSESILNTKTNGFVNIVDTGEYSQALIISSTEDWTSSDRYWKFDVNGLGYFINNQLKGIAITMNGEIVADYITTGTLNANLIKTGIIKDIYNNNSINLETGEIRLSSEKTTVETSSGAKYTLATSNDIDTVNGEITTITQQTAQFKTDITGLKSDVYSLEANYGTCSTSSNARNKIVYCNNFILKTGSVIVVKFSYKNTANNPTLNVNGTGNKYIRLNGNTLTSTSKENWGNGQTVHFVYDGNYWNIADGATESHIRQLADSIELSVTGKLGSTASITLKADGETTTKSLDMSKVREAFKNDTSTITITAGKIQFNSGTFVLNAGNCTIDANGNINASNATLDGTITSRSGNDRCVLHYAGLHCYRGSEEVGYIEPGDDAQYPPNSGQYYRSMQLYSKGFIRMTSPHLAVKNSSNVYDTAITGVNATVAYIERINSIGDGRIEWFNASMTFINGICTAIPG